MNYTGTNGNDVITGTGTADTISAGNGNDTINAGAGNDTIDAGNGDDTVNAGDGNDTVSGGNGNDTINAGAGNDTVDAGNGDDTVNAGDGNDTVSGGNGNDTINAGAGNDAVDAGNGDDTVDAGDGNDAVSGGNGNDTINAGAGNDIIDAGNGDDKVDAGAGNDAVLGGNGNDRLDGGAGNDILSAGNGDDILVYKASENVAAVDVYDGGNGQDTLRLIVSQTMANSTAFQADIAALNAKLAKGSASYSFTSFNLSVTGIESVQVVIEAGANHAPVAVADTFNADEDATLTILASALLGNDTDADANDTKTLVSVQGAQHGTVSINPAGNVVFTAEANYSGVASFTYTMKDAAGATSTATVTVNLAAVNDAAVIGNPTVHDVTEDVAVDGSGKLTASGTISISDVDGGGQASFQTTVIPTAGNLGTLVLASNGTYTYSVDNSATQYLGAGQTKDDTFTVTAQDGTTKLVSFTIHGTNDAAVITGTSTANLTESNAILSTGGSLSATDIDGAATFTPQTNVAGSNGYGRFSIDAAGAWTYSTDTAHDEFVAGQTYTDSLTVTTADGTAQTITVSILGTNDAALITGTSAASLTESNAILSTGGSLSATDVDSAATFTPQSNVAGSNGYGKFSIDSAGTWTYSTTTAHDEFVAGQTYTDSLSVTTADGTSQVITVSILGTNDAAVITGTSAASLTESNAILSTGGSLSATDVDSAASFVPQSNMAGSNGYGHFSIDAAGAWTYSTDTAHDEFVAGQTYTDSLTVTTADGTPQTITVSIVGSNDAALITGTSTVGLTETNALLSTGGSLSVSDVDSAPTFTPQTDVAGSNGFGQFSINSAGTWTYSTNTAHDEFVVGQTYTDSLSVTTADGTSQVITVSILGTNDAAVITGTSAASLTETNAILSTGGSLSATDVDSAASFVPQSNMAGSNGYGHFSIDAAGVWTYSTDTAHDEFVAGQTYTDSLTVTTADGTPQTITVSIVGSNDAALITGTSTVDVTETDAVLTTGGSLSVSDVDSAPTFTPQTDVAGSNGYGQFSINAAGAWTYSTDTAHNEFLPGQTYTDSLTVTTADGTPQTITVNILGTNDAPVAVADTLAATEDDTGVIFTTAQLLGNDTDADNSNPQLSIASVTSGAHGTAVLDGNGNVVFTPDHDFNGQATFSYTVSDGSLTSAPATVTVNVAPVASEPVIITERVEQNASADPIALSIDISGFDASDTPSSTVQIGGVPDTYKLNHGAPAAEGDGVWIVDTSHLGDLKLVPAVEGSVGAAGTITLTITVSSFDHGSVATTTGELNVQINDPEVFRVVDGYIADALVFVDVNLNGENDDGIFAYTGPDGTFSLDTSGGPVIMQSVHDEFHNTKDVLTGLDFHGTLKAPSGSTVVTPLTTLIVAVGGDPVVAEASVKAALGLSSSVDLTTLDPIAGTVSDAPGAAEVLAASIQVQATVSQLSAATGASSDAVVGVLAQAVSGGGVDLGTSTTVTELATAVNDTLPPEEQLSAADLNAVTAVVSESNAQISSGVTGSADLSQVAQAAQVAFGSTTAALADAANSGTATTFADVQAGYTGAALEQKIAEAPLILTGSEVADTLTGGGGNDTISGLGGGDTLKGGAGNDTLSGGAGKDNLTGGAGDDTLDGGADLDKAIYTDATGGITANLGTGTVTGAGVGTDTLIAVEGIIGSNYGDQLDATGFTGTSGLPGAIAGFNEFEGGGGDDVIIGGRNAQGHTLTRVSYLGASAGVTVDIATGQAAGTAAGDLANVGTDTISNIQAVVGSNYNDTLLGSDTGSGTFEAFEGRQGNDFIDGKGGYDIVSYANDLTTSTGITVNLAAGTVTGDSTVGTDTLRNIEAARATAFNDIFDATNFGNAGTANLGSLGTFNDFQGGGGNDTVIGNGNTRVNFSNALAGVTVNLQANLSQPGVTATNVAGTATGTTEGNDTLTGVNAVQGSSFNDTLLGSNFNNTFIGLGGDDTIDGRAGFDTAGYNSMTLATGGITVMMTAGTVTDNYNGVIGNDTLKSIEGIGGTSFADSYNAMNYGAAGFLDANLYNVGNNGTFNQFEGLGGNDTITGNNNTRLLYGNATAGITATFSGSFAGTVVGGDASVGTDTFTGVNSITGSGFADSITGDSNNNAFDGGAGDDNINGGGGSDTITGGAGNDTINGGSGTDMAVYTAAFGSYTLNVTSPGAGTITGPDGADSFSNIEVLQFSNRYQMVSSGSGAGASSINVSGLGFGGNANTFFGTTNNDFLTIGQNLGGRLIDLQGGTDTLFLGVTGGYTLSLANVENLVGTGGDDFVGLSTTVNGLSIDLGAGSNDGVNLANGANTVSVTNVENLNGTDFSGSSNDTLTLGNVVSGLSVNLGNGDNTLNLAAGGGSFTNIFNVQHINGTSSDDVLTIGNGLFEPGNNPIIDLGGGDNTLNLGAGGANFSALNVQHLNGNALDNFFTLTNTVTGMAVDLGDGSNDTLNLANGANSLSVTNVENISGSDFAVGSDSNDTLTLGNVVSGLSVNLGNGDNTLNLAAGGGSFTNIFNVQHINGTSSDDVLTISGGIFEPGNNPVFDLGGGDNTLNLSGGGVTFAALNVQHLNGDSANNYFALTNNVTGMAVDLGDGSDDNLILASGANSVSVTNVETIGSSDYFGGPPASDDALTLLGNVSGLTVNLQAGSNNTLNLAEGTNSVTLYNVQTINGTASADTLTILNNAGGDTIDLGAGADTLNLAVGASGVTVKNVENVNGSADADFITVADTAGPTTITGGLGGDSITVGAEQDFIRYTSASESPAGGMLDSVTNFDATTDRITLDHVAGLATEVHFVSDGVLTGSAGDRHSDARLSGNVLEIDVDGDGQIGAGDIQLLLNDLNGTLSDANFITSGVNHAPTDIALGGSSSVAENSAAGTVVGALSAFDPDSGDSATFSLVNPTGAFAIDGSNLVVAGAIDYEAGATQDVSVRVTDAGGLSYDKTFTIAVTDANDAPSVTSGATGTVAENAAISTVVYQATASDPDGMAPNNTISWSLTGTDAGAFSIDSSGNVTLNNSADYEAKSSYSINVVATDGGNLSASQAVTINVTDANDAPTVTSGALGSVAENAATSAVVYQATASDPDGSAPNNTISWSLTGTDAGAFSIDATGQVTLNSSANYEAKSSYSINVVATDGGNLSASQAVIINVSDVNEGPTVTSGASASVAENAAASTVVYQAAAGDPDTSAPNNSISWSLTGTDAGAFSIDSNGAVRLNMSANFEAKSSYSFNVVATDGGNLSDGKAVAVSITDVNEAPTDISLSNSAVPQGTSAGTVVGALSAIDPDAGDTVTFSLVGDGAGGQFSVSGGNIVVAGPLTAGAQQVTVRVTDAGNLTYDETITIDVNAGATITGDGNSNNLVGTAGADTISGLGGIDYIQGLGGNDQIDGGSGQDLAIYADATNAITVMMAAGTVAATGADAGIGSDTLNSIEAVQGSNFDDTYTATGYWNGVGTPTGANQGSPSSNGPINNTFEGLGGNDTITGNGRTTAAYFNATAGVTVTLSTGAGLVTNGSAVSTGGGNAAGIGNDTLVGVNWVTGSEHADVFNGGTGNDVFTGRAGNDQINGGTGFDLATYTLTYYDNVTAGVSVNMTTGVVTGDASVGTDTLKSIESVRLTNFADTYTAVNFGAAGFTDPLTYNVGNNGTFNEVEGMGGNDNITGNNNTRIKYDNAAAAVTVNLQTGIASGTAAGDIANVGTDTLSTTAGNLISQVRLSMFDDTVLGSNATAITEQFEGWAGNDQIDGAGGFDIALYGNNVLTQSGINANMTTGIVTGDSSIGTDTLKGIEGMAGTNFADTYTATNFGAAGFVNPAVNNVGNNGTFNQFEGLGGDDSITGNGNTRIIYSAAPTSGVTINMQAGTASGATVGNDTFVGVGSVTGSNQNDTYNAAGFTGVTSAGNFGTFNLFEGLNGNDTITGNNNTRISYSQSGAGVTVTFTAAGVGTATGTAIGTDTITGGVFSVAGSNNADTFNGSSADETFFAAGGADQINAGGGNDGITGQGGNDTIDGGAGTDMVNFTGNRIQYTVSGTGTVTVTNIGNANGDNVDTLTNVEVLQFANAVELVSSGAAGSPIDISGQFFNSPTSAVSGTAGDDYLRVGGSIGGRQLNLGAGTDTVILNSATFGGGFTLNLSDVENVTGSSGDEFVSLTTNASGLVIDLAGGNDSLTLAGGTNSLSISGVENVSGSDFGPNPAVNDILTLQNQVSGINISLGNGDNTMNLAAGANSFTNIYDVNHVNGTTGDDVLTVTGQISAANGTTIDLDAGEDTLVVSGFAMFAAVGIEHINGDGSDSTINLTSNVSGETFDLGGGNDSLTLAGGTNTLSMTGVEGLSLNDFGGDDTLTLLSTVSGVTVNLGVGTNTLNLAAGTNSFDNVYGATLVNGSSSEDTVTFLGNPAEAVDLGDGADTVTFATNVYGMTVSNTENINLAANFDNITIDNASTGSTTITAGAGADTITASAGADNFRFTSTADSAAGSADTINDFDADNDTFTFTGMSIAGDHVEFVDGGGALLGGGQASAHLVNSGPGNDMLQIDTDGDSQFDMEVSLQNSTGTWSNNNFLITI